MPTYEYACPKCGHEFEQFQSMRDEPLKKCPQCKKTGVKRLVGGGAGLIFKGSGFYITDYKAKKGTPHTDGAPAAKPAGDSKSAAAAKPAADAKPAASAAAAPVKSSAAKK
jgi:putative FmdB family regulatory protein